MNTETNSSSPFVSETEINDIDAHLAGFEQKQKVARDANSGGASQSPSMETLQSQVLKGFNLCAAVRKAEPVLKVLRKLLFFKPTWQAALDAVIAGAEELCPVVS